MFVSPRQKHDAFSFMVGNTKTPELFEKTLCVGVKLEALYINVHLANSSNGYFHSAQFIWLTKITKLQTFTENLQLDLRRLLSCRVPGHTLVSALIVVTGPQDPQRRRVLNPNRKSVAEPSDLRAGFSLDHTW